MLSKATFNVVERHFSACCCVVVLCWLTWVGEGQGFLISEEEGGNLLRVFFYHFCLEVLVCTSLVTAIASFVRLVAIENDFRPCGPFILSVALPG